MLHGSLPQMSFTPALQDAAERRWRWNAAFSLLFAEHYAGKGDSTACAGMLARGALQTAHGLPAARAEWAFNEKRLLDRAGLTDAHDILAAAATTPAEGVAQMRQLLDPPHLDEFDAHLSWANGTPPPWVCRLC